MKKIAYIVISLLLIVSYSYGQGEVEANQFSRTDLYGTARAISMGGAFGALGGDLTGVSINPAGIAVYRSSEVSTTAVLQSNKLEVGNINQTKNNFAFHNLGFVGYFPTRNEAVPVVNFGFSYNKVKSFDRELGAYGANREASLTDYMSHISTAWNNGLGIDPDEMNFSSHPWLSGLGFESYLIDDNVDDKGFYYTPILLEGETANNTLRMSERGSIDVYDFTVGTSINNVLNLGLSLSVTDIHYSLSSRYDEEFSEGGNFNLHNWLTTDGNGVGVKIGIIYRPIHALRLGLSYHSPTWYDMTDSFNAKINSNLGENESYTITPDEDGLDYYESYNFRSPDKWTASAALVLGSDMIVSLDYELTNYGSMKYSLPSNSYDYPIDQYDYTNDVLKTDFKSSSAIRAGFEYRFTPQFYGRLGYAWMQNPYDKTLVELGDAEITDSRSEFRIEGDTNYFTGGLGYRFNRNFYLDFALVYKTQEDDLYSFPNVYNYETGVIDIDAKPYKLTNNSIRGLLTFGFKF
jgi:hypothetical protein